MSSNTGLRRSDPVSLLDCTGHLLRECRFPYRGVLFVAVTVTMGLLSACGDPESDAILTPAVEFATVGDSSGLRLPATHSLAALGASIILPQSTSLTVAIKERNAAWWHRLSVVSPEIRVLAGPGYLFPSVGPFQLGPYGPGAVVFNLDAYNPREPHEFFGTAAAQVTGSYPSWTIGFEDGADNDFDDIVVQVDAVTVDCPPEPYFADAQFLNKLAVLWDLSYPDLPVAEQRERFGWIVERNGRFEIESIVVASDACGPIADKLSDVIGNVPREAVGWVHTHPAGFMTPLEPSDCKMVDQSSLSGTGPSTGDIAFHEWAENLLGGALDGIILEPFRVWEFSSTDPRGQRYPFCNYR